MLNTLSVLRHPDPSVSHEVAENAGIEPAPALTGRRLSKPLLYHSANSPEPDVVVLVNRY